MLLTMSILSSRLESDRTASLLTCLGVAIGGTVGRFIGSGSMAIPLAIILGSTVASIFAWKAKRSPISYVIVGLGAFVWILAVELIVEA